MHTGAEAVHTPKLALDATFPSEPSTHRDEHTPQSSLGLQNTRGQGSLVHGTVVSGVGRSRQRLCRAYWCAPMSELKEVDTQRRTRLR